MHLKQQQQKPNLLNNCSLASQLSSRILNTCLMTGGIIIKLCVEQEPDSAATSIIVIIILNQNTTDGILIVDTT